MLLCLHMAKRLVLLSPWDCKMISTLLMIVYLLCGMGDLADMRDVIIIESLNPHCIYW
jgi:hypothetical protein